MRILFDCASDHGGDSKHTLFIQRIYRTLADVYRKDGHQCQFATCGDKGIFESDYIPDVLFVWNGSMQSTRNRVERYKKLGARVVLYSEKGWLPADAEHFYFDRQGVNYRGTLKDWRYRGKLPSDRRRDIIEYLRRYHEPYRRLSYALPDSDFVFLPLQVEADSQIVLYSPFKTMQELIDYTAERIPDRIIYVKGHPCEQGIKADELKYPANCRFVDGNIHNFLSKCAYMITINSTAGVEALTYLKPVIVLGDAFYGKLGHRASAGFEYARTAAEREAKNGVERKDKILAFLHYLVFKRQWMLEDLRNPERARGLLEGRVDKY